MKQNYLMLNQYFGFQLLNKYELKKNSNVTSYFSKIIVIFLTVEIFPSTILSQTL